MTLLPDANPSLAPEPTPPVLPAPQIVRFGVPRATRAVRIVLGVILAFAGLGVAAALAPLASASSPSPKLLARFWAFGAPGALVAASGLLAVRDITFDIARKRYRMRRGVLPFVKSEFGDTRDAKYVLVGPSAPPPDDALRNAPPVPQPTSDLVCEVVWDRRGLSRTRLGNTEMRWMREKPVSVTSRNAPQLALRLADALELPLLDARPPAEGSATGEPTPPST